MIIAPSSRREARKDDRRRSILAEAERSFFENGYAGTSMSAIAAALGGSKATLWSYFSSKEQLFEAMLDSKVEDFAASLDAALLSGDAIDATLASFGIAFLQKILRPDLRALRRMIEAEGARFPEIAAAMYERGPRRTRGRLADYLAGQMTAKVLREGDPQIAARQFIALCQAISFSDRVWHRPDAPEPDPADDVGHAVDTFLRAWAVSPTRYPAGSIAA